MSLLCGERSDSHVAHVRIYHVAHVRVSHVAHVRIYHVAHVRVLFPAVFEAQVPRETPRLPSVE